MNTFKIDDMTCKTSIDIVAIEVFVVLPFYLSVLGQEYTYAKLITHEPNAPPKEIGFNTLY